MTEETTTKTSIFTAKNIALGVALIVVIVLSAFYPSLALLATPIIESIAGSF